MAGPQDFIESDGELYEIRRGDSVCRAKGLVLGKGQGRKHIIFLPETDVQLEDVLYGTISKNRFRVIEIERPNYGDFGVVIKAYIENLDRIVPPDKATSRNTINIHTMTNSALQQASPGAVQNLYLKTETKADVQEFVNELLARVEELGLNDKDKEEVVVHAETAKSQLKLEKPKAVIVEGCLEGIKEIVQAGVKTGATGAAAWALSHLQQLMSSGLF